MYNITLATRAPVGAYNVPTESFHCLAEPILVGGVFDDDDSFIQCVSPGAHPPA